MVPSQDGLSRNAEKRLEAIQNLEELGSGFYLAMHDLEIRGAGEVLGEAQSGNLQEVGFDLYTQMLNAAVARALRSGREPDPDAAAGGRDRNQPAYARRCCRPTTSAMFSNGFRCTRSWPRAKTTRAWTRLREELVDRFGRLPPAARALCWRPTDCG